MSPKPYQLARQGSCKEYLWFEMPSWNVNWLDTSCIILHSKGGSSSRWEAQCWNMLIKNMSSNWNFLLMTIKCVYEIRKFILYWKVLFYKKEFLYVWSFSRTCLILTAQKGYHGFLQLRQLLNHWTILIQSLASFEKFE